jgi:hypothetical protein
VIASDPSVYSTVVARIVSDISNGYCGVALCVTADVPLVIANVDPVPVVVEISMVDVVIVDPDSVEKRSVFAVILVAEMVDPDNVE